MEQNTNWQQEYKFERIDPNLSDDFIDYLADKFPDASWGTTYVHWHPSVGEYCVYIEDKWSGYVPEEYIFKAGFDHYKKWNEYWIKYEKLELHMRLYEKYVRSFDRFLKEKSSAEFNPWDYVCFIVDNVRNCSLPSSIENLTLSRIHDVLKRYGYDTSATKLKEMIDYVL